MKAYLLVPLIGPPFLISACSKNETRACMPPRAYWHKRDNVTGLQVIYNKALLSQNDRLLWNGQPVSEAKFYNYAKASHKMNPAPDLVLEVEMGASCRALERARDLMDQALECKTDYARCVEGPLGTKS